MKLGYFCKDFYRIESFEEEFSSREVLIAIGWLVYTYEIIYLFIENSKCPLDEEYYNEYVLKNNKDEFKKDFNDKIRVDKTKDLSVQMNILKLMDGLFRNKINSLHSCLMEKANLTYLAHCESSDRFSCLELYLLKHPEKIKTFEKMLENKIEFQKSILNWIKNEDLFWTWMESVVDEKISDSSKFIEKKSGTDLDTNFSEHVLKQNLELAAQEYHKFEKNIKSIDGLVEVFKTRLVTENKKDLDENELNDLKIFEKETIKNFQNIINNHNFKVFAENGIFMNKLESRLFHVNKKAKKKLANNMVMLNDINNLMEQEAKRLEIIYLEIKSEATQKCEELSSKLKNCYVVHK